MRARIILTCSSTSLNNLEVAKKLGVAPHTVGKWRKRFLQHRLDGLMDEHRPGAPRKVSDDEVERAVVATLESIPKGSTHWSTRLLAKKTGLSKSTIQRIWKAFGLKPHLVETFKLSTDPFFIEKVRDVVGLYMDPPQNALVLAIDEKSQCQALDRMQPVLPLAPGVAERRTHDYVRHGTTSLFAALNVLTGKVISSCKRQHRQQEFLNFLKQVEKQVPEGLEVHLVLDNYATHKTATIKRWLERRPHWHLHFTPTGASWLNQVERFFGLITEKCIRRGTFQSVADLERAIEKYIKVNNKTAKPFKWVADADTILGKLNRLCTRISGTPH
jgi:transposase